MSVTAKCTSCGATTAAAVDVARAAGWRIWDGLSVTGKPLTARVCPVCAGHREGDAPKPAESWRVGCRTCGWEWDDDDPDPLTEKDARDMAMDHQCDRDTWVKPPPTPQELAEEQAWLDRIRARTGLAGVTS